MSRSSSPVEASLILEMIRRLYEVEDRARPLDDAARRDLRQAEAVPILERLRAELDRLSAKLLPKSALAQAVTYALNQWQALCRYTEDGRLTIDNNVSERRVRDQAIGRKNWWRLKDMQSNDNNVSERRVRDQAIGRKNWWRRRTGNAVLTNGPAGLDCAGCSRRSGYDDCTSSSG